MKSKRIWLVMVLAMGTWCLASCSCVTGGGDDGNDDAEKPNFVQETCSGCVRDEQIKSAGKVTGYRFYSYVKNIGGSRQDRHDHQRRLQAPPARSSP